ncbi:Suppressor of tumorigenicity 14 protein [Branchiostoma belcheri]|nr:Suppressor of tumorigenicity 14 protein [Branchiostoma belcheri]
MFKVLHNTISAHHTSRLVPAARCSRRTNHALKLQTIAKPCGIGGKVIETGNRKKRIVGGGNAEAGIGPGRSKYGAVITSSETLAWPGLSMVVSDNMEPVVTLEDGTQATEAPRLKNSLHDSNRAEWFEPYIEDVSLYTVYTGNINRGQGTERDVETIIPHPDFDYPACNNDIALLCLTEESKIDSFNNNERPICLPSSDPVGSVWTSGWGRTSCGKTTLQQDGGCAYGRERAPEDQLSCVPFIFLEDLLFLEDL